MTIPSYIATAFVLLVAVGVFTFVDQAVADDVDDCTHYQNPERTIRGCTRLLKSGRLTKKGSAIAYYNRAIAYGYKDQHDNAVKDYDKAIELDPQDAQAYVNRGSAYGYGGQYNRAIQDFDTAIKLNPKDAVAYFNRGLAYLHECQFGRAVEDYDKAIELNPEDAEVYKKRGLAYGHTI